MAVTELSKTWMQAVDHLEQDTSLYVKTDLNAGFNLSGLQPGITYNGMFIPTQSNYGN